MYIGLSMSGTYLLLQLEISYGLVNFDIINKVLNVRLLCIYL
jgi:hypothetical protein